MPPLLLSGPVSLHRCFAWNPGRCFSVIAVEICPEKHRIRQPLMLPDKE